MMYVDYNPDNAIHRKLPLLEIVSYETDEGIIATTYRSVDESQRKQADATPYFFVVQIKKE